MPDRTKPEMEDREKEEVEEWADPPETPPHYRILEKARGAMIEVGKGMGKLLYASAAATVSLFVSFTVISLWLGSVIAPGTDSGPVAALSLGARNLNPFLDSLSPMASQFSVLFALTMFWCGVATWWAYTRAANYLRS